MNKSILEKQFETFNWIDIEKPSTQQLEEIAIKFNLDIPPFVLTA